MMSLGVLVIYKILMALLEMSERTKHPEVITKRKKAKENSEIVVEVLDESAARKHARQKWLGTDKEHFGKRDSGGERKHQETQAGYRWLPAKTTGCSQSWAR